MRTRRDVPRQDPENALLTAESFTVGLDSSTIKSLDLFVKGSGVLLSTWILFWFAFQSNEEMCF